MRVVGVGLLALGFVLAWSAAADATRIGHENQFKTCERNGVVYKPMSYCYTSCTPNRACEVDVCFSDGEWANIGPCKVLDCRKVC